MSYGIAAIHVETLRIMFNKLMEVDYYIRSVIFVSIYFSPQYKWGKMHIRIIKSNLVVIARVNVRNMFKISSELELNYVILGMFMSLSRLKKC